MREIKIAIREMAEYVYMSGDLSADTFQNVSAIEGTRAHQHVQRTYGREDEAEVPISLIVERRDFRIILAGRMDGLLLRDKERVIHEIKSTRKSIHHEEFIPSLEHDAQLKFYCFLYAKLHGLDQIWGRLTYIQLGDYQMRDFDEIYLTTNLEVFFDQALEQYLDWLSILSDHHILKIASIKETVFPFDTYRRGQRQMMSAVYQTMRDQDILYTVAPTGIGKTMAALFSSIKALDTFNQKIFYLTAKTQGKRVALESMEILHEGTLKTKTLELTSKDSICFLEKRECDPNVCPFAKGFFDRLKHANLDLFTSETYITREVIERYAKKHTVCPFEFSLYVSYFVDVIICDYNYVFDPRAHLIRYFESTDYQPLLLIDEAHNMVSRSREMYSASIRKSDLIRLRKAGSKLKPSIRHMINKVIQIFDQYDTTLGDDSFQSKLVYDSFLIDGLQAVLKKIDHSLKDNPNYTKKSEVFDGYFLMLQMVKMVDRFDTFYRFHIKRIDNDLEVSLKCLDASLFIKDTIDNYAYGTVFFSATLEPLDYYKTLLTKGVGETLQIRSPFDPKTLKVIVDPMVSTRYQDREDSVDHVVKRIREVLLARKGNYIVFFPSYQYLQMVKDKLGPLDCDLIVQTRDMEIKLRSEIMERFEFSSEKSLLAMFVMGGMFSEGIDYFGDMLTGVIIVGVGLPMISQENDELRQYYEKTFQKGFQFAYQYPGMNKVIQAVGRVIRSHEDFGFALLIDDRFMMRYYQTLFPKEWKGFERLNKQKDLTKILQVFYKNYD